MFRVKRTCENVWRLSSFVQIDNKSKLSDTLNYGVQSPPKFKSCFQYSSLIFNIRGLSQHSFKFYFQHSSFWFEVHAWLSWSCKRRCERLTIVRHLQNRGGLGGRFTQHHNVVPTAFLEGSTIGTKMLPSPPLHITFYRFSWRRARPREARDNPSPPSSKLKNLRRPLTFLTRFNLSWSFAILVKHSYPQSSFFVFCCIPASLVFVYTLLRKWFSISLNAGEQFFDRTK